MPVCIIHRQIQTLYSLTLHMCFLSLLDSSIPLPLNLSPLSLSLLPPNHHPSIPLCLLPSFSLLLFPSLTRSLSISFPVSPSVRLSPTFFLPSLPLYFSLSFHTSTFPSASDCKPSDNCLSMNLPKNPVSVSRAFHKLSSYQIQH